MSATAYRPLVMLTPVSLRSVTLAVSLAVPAPSCRTSVARSSAPVTLMAMSVLTTPSASIWKVSIAGSPASSAWVSASSLSSA